MDCVDVGSLSSFMRDYLNGFMLEHKLDSDSIISNYIKVSFIHCKIRIRTKSNQLPF